MDKRSILFVIILSASLFFVNQWFDSKDKQRKQTAIAQKRVEQQIAPAAAAPQPSSPTTAQQYYVLENAYQQIVISTLGGAVAEINLPLKTEKEQKSIVLPIEFDRTMEKDYPYNDYYPSFPSYVLKDGQATLQEGSLGGYYPLLRRSILGPNNNVQFLTPAEHYAFATVSSDPTIAKLSYKVTSYEKDLIQLEASDSYRRIVKTYSFPADKTDAPYCFDLSIRIEGDARDVWITTGVPEVELISDNFSPSLKYLLQRNQKNQVENISLPKGSTAFTSVNPTWLSNSNGFLGLIVNPLNEMGSGFKVQTLSGASAPTRLSIIDAHYDLYPADKYPGYEILLPLKNVSSQTTTIRVFAGPYEDTIFKRLDTTFIDPTTGSDPSYISALSFQGWFTFISEPFAKFLFILMKLFYKVTSSWGISIILLTIALRVMLYPLNGWSIKSSLRMQQIAPQVTAIQEKYKKDPKRAQLEVVALYREKGVNPLTGCFPILIQIPFLIGMFDLLKSAFDLRGATFIPGWINNLTSPDIVFSWNYPIIFFGTDFHLLPFLLGAVMYCQQKFSSPLPKDKKLLTDQQKQQKMMGNIMVIVFTVMFYHFPSGLNLYWLSSMALGILQQWFTNKRIKNTSTTITIK